MIIRRLIETRKWTYIFRWHNFLELVQCEFLLSLSNIFSEHLLEPGNIFLIKDASFSIKYVPISSSWFGLLCNNFNSLWTNKLVINNTHNGFVITITKDINSSTVVVSSWSLSMHLISLVTTPLLDQIWKKYNDNLCVENYNVHHWSCMVNP